MFRIDGRVLAASVLVVFLVGAAIGFAVGGVGGSDDPAAGDPTPTPTAMPSSTPAPTAGPTAVATGTGTAVPTPGPTTTAAATVTPTSVPTPTPTATATVRPEPTPTRTPMLVRRFDTAEIEHHLRRLVNDWREERGLRPFTNAEGRLVKRIDGMATAHSVNMADAGETVHRLDNTSSAGRYRANDLFETCQFKKNGAQYIVTPTDNRLEVLGKTYAGRAYETPEGIRYNEDERAVARAIFEGWTDDRVFRERLSYANATRIGIGIETTERNEVYVTGNLCGVFGSS